MVKCIVLPFSLHGTLFLSGKDGKKNCIVHSSSDLLIKSLF